MTWHLIYKGTNLPDASEHRKQMHKIEYVEKLPPPREAAVGSIKEGSRAFTTEYVYAKGIKPTLCQTRHFEC
jgi:hypothetical protein